MSRRLSSWISCLAGVVSVGALGCGSSDNSFSPVASGEGGVSTDVHIADALVVPDVAPDVRDAAAAGAEAGVDAAGEGGGGTTDAPATDGPDVDGAPVVFTVAVTIDNLSANAIVQALKRFAPQASITVVSSNPSATDTISDVEANLVSPTTKMKVVGVKLTQTHLETVPESTTVVYRYGDTPLDLASLPSSVLELVVTAKTVGGVTATATVTIQVDAGPTIRIDSPGEGKAFRGSAAVDVNISDPLFNPISDVTMTLGQRVVTFVGPGGNSGTQYTANIDFNKYSPPLEGDQLLTVTGKNKNGTMSTLARRFVADSRGPSIINSVPKVGDLIGKVVAISAEISDPAGVLDSSVVVVIAHGDVTFQRKLDPPPAGSPTRVYSTLFDTSDILPNTAIFPSISFRASDVLGNESSVGYLVSLDNTPPMTDMDPPQDFRGLILDPGGFFRCSWPFDPVGPDATDDGDMVAQVFDLRARIEDQGNQPSSGQVDFIPISGVEEGNAKLLILDDVTLPLVVDTNGDQVCDSVNPLLTPTTTPMSSRDALLITLAPIPFAGIPDYTPQSITSCLTGAAGLPPNPVCDSTYNFSKINWDDNGLGHAHYMSAFLPYTTANSAAIWTIPPIVADGLQCAGRQFDAAANNIRDGWACLAIDATDRLGNHQVSRPMRVCVDHDGSGGECPHKAILRATNTTPIVVETKLAHGYSNGALVQVRGVLEQTTANGSWSINVIDATHFSLVGSKPPVVLRPIGAGGWVVQTSEIPNCTGTQSAKGPPPVINNTPCNPWRLFPAGGQRRF